MKLHLATIAIFLAASASVYAQGGASGTWGNDPGNNSHEGHSKHFHQHDNDGYIQSWWVMTDWKPNVVYYVKETKNNDNPDYLVDTDHTDNANCDLTPLVVLKVSNSVTHTVSVSWDKTLGGSLEWAAGSLFAKCKTTVNAQVTKNDAYSDTENVLVEKSITITVPKCKRATVKLYVKRLDRSLEMEAAEAEFRCQDTWANKYSDWEVVNKQVLTADGLGHKEKRHVLTTEKLCECEPEVEEQEVPVHLAMN